MQKLIDGIHRFQKEIFLSQRKRFETVEKGQRLDTLFVTCSGSRIDRTVLTNSDSDHPTQLQDRIQ